MVKPDKIVKDDNKKIFKENPLVAPRKISVSDETEQKVELIESIESLAVLNRQELSMKRQNYELITDNKKLDAAKKIMDNFDLLLGVVLDPDVLEVVKGNIKRPLDIKLLAEAMEKLIKTHSMLMNPNVADEIGTKKRHKINFMFRSSGPAQAAVQIETDD